MYNSLKKQKRMRGHTRRSVCCKPLLNKHSDLPSTDDVELAYIERAVKNQEPLYFIQHINGSTLDVSPDPARAINMREAIESRISQDDLRRVNLFKRVGVALIPIA